ncbi:hypothetical protein TNCV_2022881 [Trichonephila clavipes]|nr:hypothetical protein TNCV_2022881 [Trichonephila clavipes]
MCVIVTSEGLLPYRNSLATQPNLMMQKLNYVKAKFFFKKVREGGMIRNIEKEKNPPGIPGTPHHLFTKDTQNYGGVRKYYNCTRAIGDGSGSFEPWPSDEDDT